MGKRKRNMQKVDVKSDEYHVNRFSKRLQDIRKRHPVCPDCGIKTDHVYFCMTCDYIHCQNCHANIEKLPKYLIKSARIALSKSDLY